MHVLNQNKYLCDIVYSEGFLNLHIALLFYLILCM